MLYVRFVMLDDDCITETCSNNNGRKAQRNIHHIQQQQCVDHIVELVSAGGHTDLAS
jgi:hypothetical protein